MYKIFYDSTTADSSDMNDNFYEIGSGSIFPKGGNYLLPTNNAYNLGSSTYKWADGYFSKIYSSDFNVSNTITASRSIRRLYNYIVTKTTTRIEFSINTLTSDLLILGNIISTPTGAVYFFSGGDSTTTNYPWMANLFFDGAVDVFAVVSYTSSAGFPIYYCESVTSLNKPFIAHLFNRNYLSTCGDYNIISCCDVKPASTTAENVIMINGYASGGNTLTVQIVCNMTVGSYIQIWEYYR